MEEIPAHRIARLFQQGDVHRRVGAWAERINAQLWIRILAGLIIVPWAVLLVISDFTHLQMP